jgi:hypothetical protein
MSVVPDEYRDFDRLYDSVTDELKKFVQEGCDTKRISKSQEEWFQSLIDGFRKEFEAWQLAPSGSPLGRYLDLFNHGASRRMRLSAHAFLHVAYDLPRVVACTLRKMPGESRIAYRSLFLRPAPLFRQVFLDQARQGRLGLLARPLGYLKVAEILSYWLLSLRSVAWIHAESLADSTNWVAMEHEFAEALVRAGKRAGGRIEKLDNSTLFRVASPLTVASQHPLTATAAVLGLAGLVAAALIRVRNERLAKRIAYFGACVYIEVAKATMTIEGKLPPAGGGPVTA